MYTSFDSFINENRGLLLEEEQKNPAMFMRYKIDGKDRYVYFYSLAMGNPDHEVFKMDLKTKSGEKIKSKQIFDELKNFADNLNSDKDQMQGDKKKESAMEVELCKMKMEYLNLKPFDRGGVQGLEKMVEIAKKEDELAKVQK